MSDWFWMRGCAEGKKSDAVPARYGAAWEGGIVQLVNAGFTHIYVNDRLVFVAIRQKRDYLKDNAFCARVCALRAQGQDHKEIARGLKVNVMVVLSVLKRGVR